MMSSTKSSQNESAINLNVDPSSSSNLLKVQNDVDEVLDIIRKNVDKVVNRDAKIHELNEQTEALLSGASQFHSNAAQAKRKMWWENMKMKIILSLVGIFLFILIGYFIVA